VAEIALNDIGTHVRHDLGKNQKRLPTPLFYLLCLPIQSLLFLSDPYSK